MPNWVEQKLIIDFTKQEDAIELFKIAERAKELEDEDYSVLMYLIPRPLSVFSGNLGAKEREIHGNNNWYTWNNANWGTKWSETISKVEMHGKRVGIEFQTAWSPTEEMASAVAEKYECEPILLYVESGCDFIGYTNGNKIFDQTALSDILDDYDVAPYDQEEDYRNPAYCDKWYEDAIHAANQYFYEETTFTLGAEQGLGG